MDEESALRRIAERIANNAYWDGPSQFGDSLVWRARIPHGAGRQEVGIMELTVDRLTVRDYGAFDLGSLTASTTGRYSLTAENLFPAQSTDGQLTECSVTFEANDHITSEGNATNLILQLLAHGLLE